MNIKKAAASILFVILAMVCNASMAFASWGGGWGGFTSCVLCGASTLPTQVYSSSGVQKYTEFYGCDEIEGLESSTTHKYRLKNLYCVKNADGIICPNCLERIISDHKGNTGGDDDSVYTITVPESVTLANTNGGTGDYTNTVSIKATGKLLTNQKVFFNTSAPTMHRDGSTDVVCTATATTATEWDATAVKGKTAQTDYSVTAHLTPGEWTGNMVFYASVGDTYTVEVGDNSVLLSPAYEDKSHIVFESNNPSVASISSDGHIIASSIGTANITKTAYDSTGTRVIYSSKYTIKVTAQMPLMNVSRLASVLTTLSSQGKNITVISFGHYAVPGNVTTYDVSGQSDKSIVAYVPSTMSGWGIQGSSELRITDVNRDVVAFASGNSICFKSGASDTSTAFDNIKTINFDAVDTTRVTSAAYAFYNMKSLTSITGLSRWDTSKITTMNSMFKGCTGLTSLDFSSFNTKNVTNFSSMMSGCTSLTKITVADTFATAYLPTSGSSTGLVYVSRRMGLTIAGNPSNALSGYKFTSDNRTVTYDTSTASDDESDNEFPNEDSDNTVAPAPTASMNVSNLAQAMTQLKESGTEIKAVSFGDYQVPESAKVFDVSGIGSNAILAFVKDDENRLYVTNSAGGTLVFGDGNSISFDGNEAFADIENIEYQNVDTSQVTSAASAFSGMKKLTSIGGLENWNTSNITTMNRMCYQCEALQSIAGMEKWDTSKVTDMSEAFAGCLSLSDASPTDSWDTSSVTNKENMFAGALCEKAPEIADDTENTDTGADSSDGNSEQAESKAKTKEDEAETKTPDSENTQPEPSTTA